MASTVVSRQESGTPPAARIRLLGGFRVEREGEVVADSAWQRKSGKLLVKMLAVAPEHRLHREVLIDRLWPEAEPAAAGNSLHQALLAVRRVLDPPRAMAKRESRLRLAGDMVTLAPAGITVDIDEFEVLARRGLKSRAVEDLAAAADAYGGELLPEDRYEDWAEERREPLTRLYVQVLLSLAEALEGRGASFAAVDRARQALAVDATREDAHRLLMRLCTLSGHRDQALRQYQHCREALADELGVEPDGETSALYRDILAGKLGGPGSDEMIGSVPLPAVARRLARSLFAGRERPLGIFRDKLVQLRAGNGGLVLISGEAGVGKTRLAVEAAVTADEADIQVLWGTSYAEEGQLPYGAFAEAFEGYLLALPAGARERLASSYPDLTRLVTSVNPAGVGQSQTDGTRLQLFAAIARFLSEIGAVRPLLLVLDDLHAADEVSVQLVHYLARLAQQHPWLLVATFREEEVRPGDALHGVVTASMRRELADRIELLRLSRSEARTMVSWLLDGEPEETLVNQLFSLSLGNALFLQELVHAMRESGQIEQIHGQWRAAAGLTVPIPQGAAELVMARAARLGADAGRLAGLAAVAGIECSLELLREASGLSERALLDGLDEVVAMRILEDRPNANGWQQVYAFRHPLFREALYAGLSSPKRRHLHATVGAAIETVSPDEVDALAYQWTRSAHDDKAIHYLELAGDGATSRFAHEIAVTYYRDALNRIDQQQPAERTARLQSKMGKVLTRIGEYGEALQLLEASCRYYDRTGNLEDLASTVALLARAHRQQGTCEEGLAVTSAVLPRIGEGDELAITARAAGEFYISLSGLARAAGRLGDALLWAEKAGALARAASNDEALATAESRRGDALGSLGRLEEAVGILEEARALGEQTGNLIAVAEVYHNAGAFYTMLGNSKKGQEYRALAAELCERLGYPAHQAYALSELASAQFEEGRWEEARRTAFRVLQIHESIDVSWYLTYALCILGDIEMSCGERDMALQRFNRAHTLATERQDPQALRSVVRGLAEIDLLYGKPVAARVRLSSFLAERDMDAVDLIHVAPTLVDALIQDGEPEEAEQVLARTLIEAEASGVGGGLLSHLLRVNGKLRARQGRWEEAELTLRNAIAMAESVTNPMAEGQAWLEMGDLAARRGDAGEAGEHFRRALAIFQSLGARPLLVQTQSALAGLG